MLIQERLLHAIDADMQVCRQAKPNDTQGAEQRNLEFMTLSTHLEWAKRTGDDQAELEKVVRSLETNNVVRGYQHWRERSTE